LIRRRISYRARRRRSAGGANRTGSCVATKVGTTPIPGTVREDIWIGERDRPAAGNIPYWRGLHRFVGILAPLEVVDRPGAAGVIAVFVRGTCQLGARILRTWIVPVGIPVQAFPGPVVDSIERLPRRCGCGEKERAREIRVRINGAGD